ncbi:TetR/AcrR family transcriptional regulator [Nocardia halotolerans]|uniref:TetR/AcrR family transcriptional regulator n=1 Tax=Nocardia halotolerans TaxID=1755878 RepID=A0ABV8VJI8_9NOCA
MLDRQSSAPPATRPYEKLLVKGERRKLRILAAAQQLLVRGGWRTTSLAQIAKLAGVTPAGLLHHFESKQQLLDAVLEARDIDDDLHSHRAGDLIEELERVAERFERAPDLVAMFVVLLVENLQPDAPLHDRLHARYHVAVETVADLIRQGQSAGKYRTDIDAAVKAVEIVAFLNGMETSWLLEPSIPVAQVFSEYTCALAQHLAVERTR